ncbi:microcephalin [Phyllobates terribilis]|uniref:microcephalin n=1 Tax=Phyllobates terribilis TaxID=111132 RepID=UPI003CCB7049
MELSPGGGESGILTGVIAFVDVWSSNRTENYSKMFSQQLLNLGAKVSKTFHKQVTHVIYKDGSQNTWDKAVKNKVQLVSVLWVDKCRETSVRVEESGYPAINTNDDLPLLKKKRKCMQPKDFVEKTPENNRWLARKFDKMCKDLDVQKASVDIPILLFDDDGTLLYSPKAVVEDRFNAMEKRIQEMKDKRENLSPTASQMSQIFDSSSYKPSLGNSPTILTNSPHVNDRSLLDTSYEELFQSVLKEDNVPSTPINNKIHVATKDTVNSTASGSGLLTPQKPKEVKSSPERVKRRSGTRAKSWKTNLFKLADGTNGGAALLTINDPDLDFTAAGSRAISHLSFDAEKGETRNFSKQTSPRNQKCNRKVDAAHATTDSESDVFCNTSPEKDRMSEYSSMANRLTALCEEKNRSKKAARHSSLKPAVSFPYGKNKAVKVEAKSHLSSCNTDSDEAFPSFEDYFTSLDVNTRQNKLSPFSLTKESRKSPSPPPLALNDKDKSKRRRSLGNSFQETYTTKKRRTIHSVSHSDSSPLQHSKKCAASTRKESPVAGRPETSVCIKKSDVTENGNQIQTTTGSPATCQKMQDVPGGQEILHPTTGNDDGKQMKLFPPSVGSKTSASYAIGSVSEMFNEQRNKCTVDSRKTEKSRKVKRSLVMTSMSTEKQSTIIQVVKKFGGFVFSDEVSETTSHVIAGSPRRTLNIILGIVRGCWILSYDWVLWSLERGNWIPEEPYELSDHFPGAPICRLQRHLSAGEYHQNLFSSVPTFFISPSSQPPCDKLSQAVQLCGGKVCKAVRQAKVCIGMFPGKKPPDLEFVSEKWVLDSITQHKLLPLQNYLLEQ